MRLFLILSGALALGACGTDPAPAPDEPVSGEPMPVEPDGGIGDGAAPLGDLDAVAANRIPGRFHGVWDHVEGACDPASDLRMEVGGDEILFYESIGNVTEVTSEGEDVVVTLAMEGEGETWEQRTRFSLVGEGEGQRLETTDGDQPKTADAYPSKRCPAARS